MNSRANILEDMDEDTSIQVIVTRASNGTNNTNTNPAKRSESEDDDSDWQDEINSSIKIRKSTEEERLAAERARKQAEDERNNSTKVEHEREDDLDYWPDDWEDEDWEE